MISNTLTIALLLDSRSYGGIETHVVNLARGLQHSGHTVQIVLLNDYGQHPVFEADGQLRSMLIKLDGKLSSLITLLKRSPINVLHTHGYKAGILGRLCAKFTKTTAVSTFHSGEKGNIKIRFYRWLDRITAHSFPCICVSEQIKQSVSPSAHVIKNFVDLPSKSYDSTTATQIAFVGRVSHEKGPDLFVDIAKRLPQYAFSIYGDGPMLKEISTAAPNNVSLMGHVNSMQGHWSQISLLCITSREEGLPLVAIEALVRGIPVVSYDIGGLSSVVIHDLNGWLIPPFNESLFIDAIVQGQKLSTNQRERMSRFAYQFIRNNFSSHAVIPKIFTVYRQALIGGSRVK